MATIECRDADGRTKDPLVESIELLTRWFDRDDFQQWVPVEAMLHPPGSAPYAGEGDLTLIRDESRFYAQSHPFALSAIENRISYVVGGGHHYKVRPRPNVEIDRVTLEKIEAELIEFQERNEWFHRQQEIQRRLDRDGEVFLRLFETGGTLAVRFVEPEHISQPSGRAAEYGLEIDPDDAETVRAYWIRRGTTGSYERVPAEQIQHRKANVDRTMPRGVPLLYSIRANLRRSWKLLRNMSTVASIQAAIAIVRKHSGAKAGTIQQYVGNLASIKTTDSQGNQKTYQQYPPGAIVDLPPGVEYEFPASGINVANYVEALQAELRAIAARLCMPEYMLSGDASNANYASTMVAEGPAVKIFERLQSEMIWYDYRIVQRALQTAEKAGRLPQGVSELVEIDAEAPMVMTRDRLKEAQADQILLTLGVISPQTVAARHGYDFEQERDLMNREAERDDGGIQPPPAE
ncbi:MAG: hypothetical protein Kow0040_14890 [Thermogutta sp.]